MYGWYTKKLLRLQTWDSPHPHPTQPWLQVLPSLLLGGWAALGKDCGELRKRHVTCLGSTLARPWTGESHNVSLKIYEFLWGITSDSYRIYWGTYDLLGNIGQAEVTLIGER